MTPEQILSVKPNYLTQKQREAYFEDGYILLERIIPEDWARLSGWDVMDKAHGADSSVIRELAGFVEHRKDQHHAAPQ